MRRELLEEREKIRSTSVELQAKEQQLAQEKANADAINNALAQQRERFLSQSKHLEDELAKANRLLEVCAVVFSSRPLSGVARFAA